MKHEPQRYRVYNVGSRPQANQHFILDIFPGSCLLCARAMHLDMKQCIQWLNHRVQEASVRLNHWILDTMLWRYCIILFARLVTRAHDPDPHVTCTPRSHDLTNVIYRGVAGKEKGGQQPLLLTSISSINVIGKSNFSDRGS